jgi:hypothetical protein
MRLRHVLLVRRVGVAQVVEVGVAQVQEDIIDSHEGSQGDVFATQVYHHFFADQFFEHRFHPQGSQRQRDSLQ